jgi:hypothetical protein
MVSMRSGTGAHLAARRSDPAMLPMLPDPRRAGGGVAEPVEVRWYAGGRGEETPRAVLLGGRELSVRVERGWVEQPLGETGPASGPATSRRGFQVRLEDGRRCRLAQQPDGSWTLEPMRP